MSSQLGFLPKEMKSLANGLQIPTDGTVIYNSPAGFHLVSTATAGPVTLTARQVLGGLILHEAENANDAVTLPTAASLAAAFNGVAVGSSIRFILKNTSSTSGDTSDITASTGITIFSGDAISVGIGLTGEFLIVFTNVEPGSEAAVLYTINPSGAS